MPPESANGAPHVRRKTENALPHDDRSPAAPRQHGGLDRATSVRDHDVDRLERELPAERTRAQPERP
jgi:hypothetical protein